MKFNPHHQKFVFAITGGGSEFISNVLTAGGASEFLIHAEVPYSMESIEAFTGGVRESYASGATARQLAVSSELKGMQLGYEKVIGVGAACSLVKVGGEREGREHVIHIASKCGGYCLGFNWIKKPEVELPRNHEEIIAATFIKIVAEIFAEFINNKTHLIQTSLQDLTKGLVCPFGTIELDFPSEFAVLATDAAWSGGVKTYIPEAFSNLVGAKETLCVYSGSYNPIHAGHEAIFRKCEELYGAENCFLELSVNNFEKPPLDSIEISKRIEGMRRVTRNILVTSEARFKDKIKVINNRVQPKKLVFAVGYDTFVRIEKLTDCPNLSFLVFPRNGKSAAEIDINYNDNVINPESFSLTTTSDLSSSDIRKKQK